MVQQHGYIPALIAGTKLLLDRPARRKLEDPETGKPSASRVGVK